MKVDDFVNKFTIEPARDIEPRFTMTKRVEIRVIGCAACFNCGNKGNNRLLKSSAWTSVQHCWSCNHLNVIYYQDRMGGVTTDIIKCFTDELIEKLQAK